MNRRDFLNRLLTAAVVSTLPLPASAKPAIPQIAPVGDGPFIFLAPLKNAAENWHASKAGDPANWSVV